MKLIFVIIDRATLNFICVCVCARMFSCVSWLIFYTVIRKSVLAIRRHNYRLKKYNNCFTMYVYI